MPDAILHLSSLVGGPLLDSSGKQLGRVEDVIARLDLGDRLPPVTGLMAKIAGRDMFVPAERVAQLEPAAARTSTTKLNLGQFVRRPGELMLRADVLGRSLINVNTARLVRANEVELTCEQGRWRVTAIDSSLNARLRRLLAAPLSRPSGRPRSARPVVRDRTVRRACAHLTAASAPPAPGAAARGPDRRLGRGCLPRGGRGDHAGGRSRQGARGRRVRGARRASTSSSSCASAPMHRSRPCSRGWRAMTRRTC